jgi:hypothetical protein
MPADGIRAATFHSYGDFGSPVIGSSARCYKSTMTIKSPRWHIRFPPWIVEELDVCFVLADSAGQQLAYVYFEDEPGRRSAAKLLS